MSARRRLPFRRDSLLFGLGVLGIAYQQVTERYNAPLMVLYGLMAGVPGLAQVVLALRGAMTNPSPDPGTGGVSSTPSSPEPYPQSQSSTSSS